jgi:hypothetical protein
MECDANDLLDEANTLNLTVELDARKAQRTIDELRHCADQARDAGLLLLESRMRQAADELQQRLSG